MSRKEYGSPEDPQWLKEALETEAAARLAAHGVTVGIAGLVVGALTVVTLAVAAIWTNGPGPSPLSSHLGWTAIVVLIVGVAGGIITGYLADQRDSHRKNAKVLRAQGEQAKRSGRDHLGQFECSWCKKVNWV